MTLNTDRLILQPLQLEDATATQQLFPRWEIVRYLTRSVPWPFPPDGAHRYYRDVALPAMQRGDEWHWTLRLKSEPHQLIGSIALMKTENHNRGFWLGQAWQSKGLMTEAVIATTDFWFEVLNFPVLRAPKATDNVASRCISKKTGMRLVATEEQDYVSGRLPTEIWEITSEEWREDIRQRRDNRPYR